MACCIQSSWAQALLARFMRERAGNLGEIRHLNTGRTVRETQGVGVYIRGAVSISTGFDHKDTAGEVIRCQESHRNREGTGRAAGTPPGDHRAKNGLQAAAVVPIGIDRTSMKCGRDKAGPEKWNLSRSSTFLQKPLIASRRVHPAGCALLRSR